MAADQHTTTSMPAPVGGLNVLDPINSMPSGDAIELINWIPQQYGVRCRKGYKEWAVGLGAACQTVLSFQPNRQDLANFRLFGVTDSAIYDVTTATNAPVSLLALAGTDGYGRLSSRMFTNTAGSFLIAASEGGGYFTYDGVSWEKRISGDEAGSISGIDPDNIVYLTSWKRRVWFIERDSTNAWYLPTDAITGEARKFELGPFVKKGGKLAFMTNWTIDAGEGIDDLLVFVFEGGDVLIYKGTDPTSVTTFALVGSFYIGAVPVGRRGFSEFGGDVVVMSEFGLQPMSNVTQGAQSIHRTQVTQYLNKIQPRLAELVSKFSLRNGWDITLFPKDNLLIINVPASTTNVFQQYVMYTNTNAWGVFEGIPMHCMAVANSELWFGTSDGRVCKALTGYLDDVPFDQTVGNPITGKIQPAYSYFRAPGLNKQFHMIRGTFQAVAEPSLAVAMLVDFKPVVPSVSPVTSAAPGDLWDTGKWDQARWSGNFNVYQDWLSVEALGFTGAALFVTQCAGDTFLASIDYMYEPGGSI